MSYNAQAEIIKIPNSMSNRIIPGVTIGALPERLGSSGTAKMPHIKASKMGNVKANKNAVIPWLCFQPQSPIINNAMSSSRNLKSKLIGCDPIGLIL